MNKKVFSILFALVLVLSFSLVTAVPAVAASEVWVDDDWDEITTGDDPDGDGPATSFGTDAFATIREGIVAVDEFGTVNVAAGTYVENVYFEKSLTIQGAGKGVTVIDAGGAAYGIKICTDPLQEGFLDSVAIKDLTVKNASHSNIAPYHTSFTELVIENVDLSGSEPAASGHRAGLGLQASTVENLLVKGCTFENIKRYGVRVDSGSTVGHLTVIDSVFDTNEEALFYDGVFNQAGIESCGNIENLTVSGSTFIGTVNGIRLFWYWGDRVTYSIDSVDIEGSTFEGNDTGFFFYAAADIVGDAAPPASGYEIGDIQIHGCSFAGKEWGVNFDDSGMEEVYKDVVIDATNNWWGATNGPSGVGTGDGDAVSENVDFSPWLGSPVEAGAGAVSMTAESEEAEIGISVSPTFIDFQTITSGEKVAGDALTVKNTGNVRITIDADITDDTAFGVSEDNEDLFFYTAALRLGGEPSEIWQSPTSFGSWTLIQPEGGPLGDKPMWANESRPLTTGLECPLVIEAGITYTGTVVFWAEQPAP